MSDARTGSGPRRDEPAAVAGSDAIEVRAPGRVNLIGEHTDYSLLPVMPMAIDKGVDIRAGRRDDGRLEATAELFPGRRLSAPVDELVSITDGWAAYVVAAVRTIGLPEGGMSLHVFGDLPAEGGLSSSSALTVGVLAAADTLGGYGLGPTKYARLAVEAERSMSIEGGSMDQIVISLAVAGDALRIDFDPPSVRPVPIPSGLRLVAAHSGHPAHKAGAVRDHYNARVVACRLAAALLARSAGVVVDGPPRLGSVAGLDDIEARIDGLPEEATVEEATRMTDLDPEPIARLASTRFPMDQPLPVRASAHHVVTEARRVDEAEEALADRDLIGFGALLDESHQSLRRFGASIPALDRLVTSMRAAGAYGARLTGAGFGGFAIAAVPPGLVTDVVDAALGATGGPAFEVVASNGVTVR